MAQTFLEFIDNQRQPAAATAPNPEHQGFLDFVDRQQGTATAKPNAHQQGFLDFIKLQKPPNTPAPPKSGPAPANAPGRGHGGVDLNNPDIPDQFSQTDEAARLQAAGTPARDLEQQTPSWTGEALPAAAQKIKAVGQGFLKTFAAVGNAPESGGLPMTYEDLQTTPREQYEAVKQDAQQQAELAEKSAQNLTGKQQTAVALAGTAEDLALKGLAYALAGQAIAPLAAPALKAAGAISNPVARVATKALIHGAKTGAEMAAVDASLNPENPLEAGKSGFVSGAALGPIGEVAGEVAGRVAKTGLGQKLTRAGLEALGMGGLTAAQKPKDKTWSEWAPEIASQALVGGFFGLKSETPAMDKAEWIGRQQKKLGDLGVRVDRQDLNDVHDRMQAADEKTAPLIWNNFFDQHAAAQEKENRDWSFARSDMKLAAGQDGVWTEPHQWEPNWSAESDPTNRETLNREPSYEKRLWRDPDTGRILYSDSETTREATPEEAQALQDQTQAYKDNGILIDPKTGERIGWKTPQNETMAQDSAVPPPVPSETFAMDDGKGGQIRYERAQNGSLWIIRSSGERQPLPPGQAQRIESRRTGQTNVLAPGIEYSKVYEEDGRGHTIYRVNGEWWDHSVNTDPKAKNPEERIEPLEPSRADKEEQAYQERKSGEPWKQGTADGLRGENTPAAPVSPWEPARKVTFSNPEVPENPNGYHVVKKGNRNYLIYDGTGKMVSAFNPSEAAANGKLASLIEESRRRFQEQKQAQQNAAPQNMAIQTNDGSSGPPPMPGKPSQPPADEVIVKSNGKKYLPSQLRLKLADLKKNGVEAEPVEFTDLPEKEKARWGYRILNAGGATTVNNPQAGMEPHPLETKATSAAAQVPPEGGTVNLTTPEGGDITKAVPAAPIQTQPPAAEGTSAYGDAGRNDPGLAAGSAERSQNQPVPAQPGAGEQRPAGALGRFQDAFNAGRNANRYRIGPAELTPEEQPLYDILSQLTGRPVQKVRELDGKAMPNGALHEGTIYISDKANDPVLAVGLHEALHDMARSSPDLYQQVMDAYADLARAGQTDAAAASRHQRGVNRARAERGLEPLGDPALREEMLADLAADYAMEKGFWQRLVQKSPEAFQKLAGKILNFFDRMIEALAGQAYQPRIKDQLLLSVQARERMRQAIGDAMAEHAQRNNFVNAEGRGRAERPNGGLENMNGTLLSERLSRLGGLSEEAASENG
jgi:hypothetical protein